MATLKDRSDNWNANGIIHRDHRNDKSSGYEETPHKKVKGKKTRPRKKPGCKGNNGKAHVYVWIGARFIPNEWGKYVDQTYDKWAYRRENNPWYTWKPWKSKEEHIAFLEAREIQICAGCYKKTGRRRKLDGTPSNSWYHWY